MAISLPSGFKIGSTEPIDTRIVLTKAEMKSVNENTMPAHYFTVCSEDNKIYVFDKTNTVDETTGKFRLYIGFDVSTATDGQILRYNGTSKVWETVDLTDDNSIIYATSNGLSIKGYSDAQQGYMLVKDTTQGLAWIKPLDETILNQKVQEAAQHAQQAGTYATQAGESAISANTSAQTAQRINEQTMEWVNDKFWWGTIEEYNALTEITEGSFYFIQLD